MHATSSTRQRSAPDLNTTGVPPVPPEDSPKAGALEDPPRNRNPGRLDVRQAVTDRIIGMLEKGGNVFRARWTRAASRGVPRNGKTGQPYHGANVLLLWDAAFKYGYRSQVWLTYKQAASLGAQVRKGERAVLCAHFERTPREKLLGSSCSVQPISEDVDAEGSSRDSMLLCRPFWLFNTAQIDGLPGEVHALGSPRALAPLGPVEGAMRLLGGCDASIRHGFERAMYLHPTSTRSACRCPSG